MRTRTRNELILRVLTICREAKVFGSPIPLSALIAQVATNGSLFLARDVVGQLCRAGALIAGVEAVAITTIGVGLERTLATNPGSLEVDFPAPSFAGDEEVTGIH